MKLSDAIAMGRVMIVPRAGTFGLKVWDIDATGEKFTVHGCALGMAAVAVGESFEFVDDWITIKWPWLPDYHTYPCDCYAGKHVPGTLNGSINQDSAYAIIIHLFDRHVMEWGGGGLDP